MFIVFKRLLGIIMLPFFPLIWLINGFKFGFNNVPASLVFEAWKELFWYE